MDPHLETAAEAARRAGEIIVKKARRLSTVRVEEKGRNDFVSEVDRMAEQAIIATIRDAWPDHEILAEESGGSLEGRWTWIIDPLDGTTNFLHGYPAYAVSIGLAHEGSMHTGLVYNPIAPEMFWATRGQGARLYGMPITVSERSGLEDTLLGTGFPFKLQKHLDAYLDMFKAIFPRTRGIRRNGSAALDLANVAAGRLDGFWEMGLMPWDMAAGALLIEEAGGRVCDFEGGDDWLASGNIVAGSPAVCDEILELIAPHVP